MATVTRPDIFPEGTTVGVYAATDWLPGRDRAGAPPGTEVTTADVTDGTVEFTGLDPDTHYVAAAEVDEVWRYVSFGTHLTPNTLTTDPAPEDGQGIAWDAASARWVPVNLA